MVLEIFQETVVRPELGFLRHLHNKVCGHRLVCLAAHKVPVRASARRLGWLEHVIEPLHLITLGVFAMPDCQEPGDKACRQQRVVRLHTPG